MVHTLEVCIVARRGEDRAHCVRKKSAKSLKDFDRTLLASAVHRRIEPSPPHYYRMGVQVEN